MHINCIHEFPSVVGPPRHACDFGLFSGDDWTPAHLTGGATNLYKEIAFALKGLEWRAPGLVAVASKLAGSAAPHKPIDFSTPSTYEPASGANPWKLPADGLELPKDGVERGPAPSTGRYGANVSARDAEEGEKKGWLDA